jgi:hypothetical protein
MESVSETANIKARKRQAAVFERNQEGKVKSRD